MKSCKSLNAFLKKHKRTKNGPYTHTRIGNNSLGIFGGSYFIPTKDRNEFYELYHKHVFVDKKAEYLTEAQDKENERKRLEKELEENSDEFTDENLERYSY